MANGTPSPATAPAEAPEIKSIQELQAKKADVLAQLQKIPNLTETEKAEFAAEFEKDMVALDAKTAAEKERDIGSLKSEIAKLEADIHGEKKDANEEFDAITGTDETTVEANQKLVKQEIRGRLDEFKASIETKLATPETPPTETPEPVEEVPLDSETQNARNFFVSSGLTFEEPQIKKQDFLTILMNKFKTMWFNMLEGFGIDVRNQKAQIEGYTGFLGKQKTEATFGTLEEYMGDSVNSITDKTEREVLVQKIEKLGIPITHIKPVLTILFTGGNPELWNNIPLGVDGDIIRILRGKYLTLRDNPASLAEMSPKDKLNSIFTIEEDKKGEYMERYEQDKKERENADAPVENTAVVVTETEEEAETTTPLSEVVSRYDGRPYEEEVASKDTIFTFEQDDIFLSIKRGDQKETANINANGTLTYRGITGTPEMIIQLARLDMYVRSLPGILTLSNKDNLSENTIKKTYFDYAADVDSFSTSTMPEFLVDWDWQKLYTFLLRDEAQKIAPAEAAEMSGEKPEGIIQEDLDIILGRTDVKETAEDAKFSGKIEENGSITITRATADGDKKWDESIFPNADGTYTIGNVRFPNITDAIKAANMRNWVRWHEDNENELHIDGNNIQVDDSTSRLWSLQGISIKERLRTDTNLIKDGKIPEFLTHGVLPDTGNALTNLSDVYDFLKGAVIDDGIYGKNKTRTKWESEQVTNTNNS